MSARSLVAGAAVLAAGAIGAGLALSSAATPPESPAAAQRARTGDDRVPARLAPMLARLGMRPETARQVAPSTYLLERGGSSSYCLLTVVGGQLPYGCSPRRDFFGGAHVVVNVVENGPPEEPEVVVAGLARTAVAAVLLRFADGSTASPPLTADRGFRLERAGARLASVTALGTRNTVLETLDPSEGARP